MTKRTVDISVELETVKKLVINNLEWQRTRSMPLGMKPSLAYEYLCEYGMRDTRKKIEGIQDFPILEELIHDIYDEDLRHFLANELEAFSNNRVKRQ